MMTIPIETRCPFCQKTTTVHVDEFRYSLWKQKKLSIQVALYDCTDDEREALKTGICPKCWDDNLTPTDPEPITFEQLADMIAGMTPEHKKMPVEVYSEYSNKCFMVYGLHIAGKNDMIQENQPFLMGE